MEEAVGERRRAFVAAHRTNENCQAYISASQHLSPVIAKAKAEGWQARCSSLSLSPRSDPKLVYSFAVSLVLLSHLPPSITSPTVPLPEVAYPMLKHLPRSGMDFLLHIFNLSWSLHFFPSIWKTSSIIPTHKMGKPLDSHASFRPTSLISCVSQHHSISSTLFSGILLHFLSQPGQFSSWTVYSRSNSVSFSVHFEWVLQTKPGSCTILATIDFSKAFDSVWYFMSGFFVTQPPFPFQVWPHLSETKTLQIFLESFWIHSPAHACSNFSYTSCLCLPSFSSLKLSLLYCGADTNLFILTV